MSWNGEFRIAWILASFLAAFSLLASPAEAQDPWHDLITPVMAEEELEQCLRDMRPLDAEIEAAILAHYDHLLEEYQEHVKPLQAGLATASGDSGSGPTTRPAGALSRGRWFEGLDFEQMQRVWRERQREVERRFQADVEALLTTDLQRRAWANTTRRCARKRLLPSIHFGRLNLAVVDVAPILGQLTLASDEAHRIDPITTAYNAAFDDALRQWQDRFSAIGAQMMELAQAMPRDEWLWDTPRTRRQYDLQMQSQQLILAVAAVPEVYSHQVIAALSPTNAAVFQDGFDRAQFQDLHRNTPVELACAALLATTMLSADQRASIEAERDRHRAEVSVLRARLIPALRKWNIPPLKATFAEHLRDQHERQRLITAGRNPWELDPAFSHMDSFLKLRDLAQDGCRRLSLLFNDEQRESLPARSRILLDWSIQITTSPN